MGYKALLFILIISLLSISCSAINYSNQPNNSKRDYNTFNRLGAKHSSKIILMNGKEIETKYVFVENDFLFYEAHSDTMSIPLRKIERVENKNWIGATGNGLVFGLATTLVTGGTLIALSPDDANSKAGGIVIMGLAALAGLSAFILGIVHGGEKEFIFNEKSNYTF